MTRNSHCKICSWTRSCGECQARKRQGREFAARFSLEDLTLIAYVDWRSLPESSGIYFAFNGSGEVLYIGQTQNLFHRWRVNYRALYRYGVSEIGFVLMPDVTLGRLAAERALIERFRPSLHGIRKPPGPKLREWEQAMRKSQ